MAFIRHTFYLDLVPDGSIGVQRIENNDFSLLISEQEYFSYYLTYRLEIRNMHTLDMYARRSVLDFSFRFQLGFY